MADNRTESSSKKGILRGILDYYQSLGWNGTHIDQALFILGVCALAGCIFILFFALQAPYQMTLYSNNLTNTTVWNATNTTITIATTQPSPPLSFWDTLFTVLSVFGAGVLVAGASFFVGGLLGFLFGIPKTIEQASGNPPDNTERYTENTNLEDISDWLTKIIIGVGLVELTQIPGFVNQFALMLAPALGGIPSSGPFGVAILVFYSIVGFLIVYLSTRGYMENELEKRKRQELELERVEKLKAESKLEKMKIETEYAMLRANKLDAEKKIRDLEAESTRKGP